jgi:hypothetical protein
MGCTSSKGVIADSSAAGENAKSSAAGENANPSAAGENANPSAAGENANPSAAGENANPEAAAKNANSSAVLTYISVEEIFPFLQPRGCLPPAVRLLDSDWLLARADQLASASSEEGRMLLAMPRRQDLEQHHPEAFMSVEDVRGLVINDEAHGYKHGGSGAIAVGAISHAWVTASHPDPQGIQLEKVAALLRAAQGRQLARQKRGWDCTNPRRDGYQALPKRVALFYDWASLFQAVKSPDGKIVVDKTSEEKQSFDFALGSMQIWYLHQKLFSIMLTSLPARCTARPYTSRGWPTIEKAWIMVAKMNNVGCWPMVYEVDSESGEACRLPPLHPDRMQEYIETKVFSSPKADKPLVMRLYRETVTAVLGEATKLSFGECGWTDAEVIAFAEVLPLCRRCLKLNLGRNDFSDDGVAALAKAVSAGALPALEVLALNDNSIGVTGVEALLGAAALGAFPSLRKLFLHNNRIEASGCNALAQALEARALPKLEVLQLFGNPAAGLSKSVCRFWQVGVCTKGENCPFVHGQLPPVPAAWSELGKVCAQRGISETGDA